MYQEPSACSFEVQFNDFFVISSEAMKILSDNGKSILNGENGFCTLRQDFEKNNFQLPHRDSACILLAGKLHMDLPHRRRVA
jgi:hypothetical protein